jgi:exopolysaccharide biosynthesis polyprenyl glycosylphosphotransferase
MSGALLAIILRFRHASTSRLPHAPLTEHVGIALLYAILIVLFAQAQKLYTAYQASSRVQELTIILKSILMATAVLVCCLFAFGEKTASRLVIACSGISALVNMYGWRQIRRHSLRTAIADGVSCHNVLIVGTNSLAQAVARHLDLHRHLGFVVLGHLTLDSGLSSAAEHGHHSPALRVLGSAAELATLCRTYFVDEILICAHDRPAVMQIIANARECRVGVRVIPDLYDVAGWGAQVDYLGAFPTFTVVHRSLPALAIAAKRILDRLLSAAALAVLSPVLILLAIVVKLDSPGPILYVSRRVGKKGREFSCYKFRTMVADAESLRKNLEHLNERDGILFKIANDPRITRAGLFLRKHSLDELPQFWNVLKGDMSIVGPRPPLVNEFEQYQLEYLRRLDVAPGITGLWQVEARNNPSFDSYISLDLCYVENWSIALDILILFRTISVVLAGTGS